MQMEESPTAHFLKIILGNYCLGVWDHRTQSNCSTWNTTAATFYTLTINTLLNLTATPEISSIHISVMDLTVLREVLIIAEHSLGDSRSQPTGTAVLSYSCKPTGTLQAQGDSNVSYCVFSLTVVDKELAKDWGSLLTETNINLSYCQQDCSHLSL